MPIRPNAYRHYSQTREKKMLTLPNMLTKTQARLKCPDVRKLGSPWFISVGAHGRPDEEQRIRPPQVSVKSWHDLFRASCRAWVWYCLSICHLCPFLMQWQVACSSVLSLLFLSLFFFSFFPGSVTVFPHRFMMKSLIVSEDLRKLLSCFLIFQTLEWKLSFCH